MKKIALIVSAVFTAVLSTLCCIPAFLFIFFGVSVGGLTFLSDLGYLRIPFFIITIILLFFAFKKSNSKNIKCACSKKEILKKSFVFSSIFLLFFVLLFYPEFSVYFIN
ncbi:transporter [Malaciobacter molluscorum]|uniref:transporter n=1 Tax=Malaciobacter molluscorum TaxID=1032072 RepID=UPI00100ABE91|nr:transporter [Malaciobacter molluscorum]RXJ94241.1 transporter [Malaciobacter molluscorum]